MTSKKKDHLEKWLLVPDCHVPYANDKAIDLMVRAASEAGIENVCLMGDFADFYAVSAHSKDPGRRGDLEWEVEQVNVTLDAFDAFFPGKKKYIAGNHEHRLERYLSDKAPALFNSVKTERLFRLKERGWEYTPYKEYTKIGKLFLTHDAGKAGPNAHRDAMNAFQGNVVLGHTHRLAYAVEGSARGDAHVGAMFGWLGDADMCEYMFKIRAARDWALGFGVAYVEGNGNVHLTPVPIVNGCVVLEGKLIK